MQYYYLQVLSGIEKNKYFRLPDGALSIGRSSGNTVSIHPGEKSVSTHHAIIYKSLRRIMLQDLQSTNGTFVNENKVSESELAEGDIIGLGKTGTRLKLIVSDTELGPDKYSERHEEIKSRDSSRTDDFFDCTADTTSKEGIPIWDDGGEYSYTGEVEKKLIDSNLDTREMGRLIKDKKRVDKILNSGNLTREQSFFLKTASGAGRYIRKKWMCAAVIIAVFSSVVLIFLSIRMVHYRNMLRKGMSLEQQLDDYEKKISEYNKNPEENQRQLNALIEKLEATKEKYSSVKKNIRSDDRGKLFSDTVEIFIDEIMQKFGESDYHIPPGMIKRVKYHLSIYSGRMKPVIADYLKRKEKYFPMIISVLKEKNLPVELAYISMLESGFNPEALSHAGARGLWQFMKKTGRSYGLKINASVDERLDPQKATYAAAEYFKDLIAIFGGRKSVMLAMAAYNAGEGRIMNALRKIDNPVRDRDFWYVYRMGHLAEETNEYIPRVISLMIISNHPEYYGFGDLK